MNSRTCSPICLCQDQCYGSEVTLNLPSRAVGEVIPIVGVLGVHELRSRQVLVEITRGVKFVCIFIPAWIALYCPVVSKWSVA